MCYSRLLMCWNWKVIRSLRLKLLTNSFANLIKLKLNNIKYILFNMEYLPDDINEDEVMVVEFDEIQKGDYIYYLNDKFKKQDGTWSDIKFVKGGFVGAIVDEPENNLKFLMLVNAYGKKWSVQDRNVLYYYKSLIEKGRWKKKEEKRDLEVLPQEQLEIPKFKRPRGRPRKVESMVLPQKEIKAKKMVVSPQKEKRPRGRPRKLIVESIQ